MIDTLLNRLSQLGTLDAIMALMDGISGVLDWLTRTNEEGELTNQWLLQLINDTVIGMTSLLGFGIALKAVGFALSGLVLLTKGVTAAQLLWNSAMMAGRLRLIGLTIQTIALRIAQAVAVIWTGAVTAAQWLWTVAMWANPIGLIIGAIAILIAAIVALIVGIGALVMNWDLVTDAVGRFFSMMGGFARNAWDEVTGLWGKFPDWLKTILLLALTAFLPFIGIPLLIITHFDTLKQFFVDLWGWIVQGWEWVAEKVGGFFGLLGFDGDKGDEGGGGPPVMDEGGGGPPVMDEGGGGPPVMDEGGGPPVMDEGGGPPVMDEGGGGPPVMDEGGIVRRPTLAALAMNRQPEVVVPLTVLTRLVNRLSGLATRLDQIATLHPGHHLCVQYGSDDGPGRATAAACRYLRNGGQWRRHPSDLPRQPDVHHRRGCDPGPRNGRTGCSGAGPGDLGRTTGPNPGDPAGVRLECEAIECRSLIPLSLSIRPKRARSRWWLGGLINPRRFCRSTDTSRRSISGRSRRPATRWRVGRH